MTKNRFFKAVLTGLVLSITTVPAHLSAETLRVMRGAPSSSLNVPMNRAVVVERFDFSLQ